LTSGTSF
jgi:antitoxin component YwqK of YwqJK toxin-antitoxin module